LQIDVHDGLLREARQVASPNFDARPAGVAADLIVVHGISLPPGEFGGPWIDQLFTNSLPVDAHPYFAEIQGLKVSSHLVIARKGKVTQYVKFDDRAWHAGKSSYRGREACNDFSIGIELEGTDTEPYTLPQYLVLAKVVAALCAAYPALSEQRVVGHSDIAPGRKTDPGPVFSWRLARDYIAEACAATNAEESLARAAPHHFAAPLQPRQYAGQHEQQVRQSIEVFERLGRHGFDARQRPAAPLRSPAHGAGHVAGGRGRAAAGKDELFQGRQRFVETVQFFFEPLDVGLGDHAVPRNAQFAAEIE
jgi:AmpD protein